MSFFHRKCNTKIISILCCFFQTWQENTPVSTAVCGPLLESSNHLLKQCSVRLERLPLHLTDGNDFQSNGNISEKHCSDCTVGKNYSRVLGYTWLHENSPAFHDNSMDWNGKALKNNFCTKISNFERPIQANRSPEISCNQKNKKSSHSLERPFKCNECDYSATLSGDLKRHVQAKHTFEKPFKCNECDYSATRASHLKRHVQAKHTLEKPFKCNECNYSATLSHTLKRHVLATHTFERPFKCNECDYSATRKVYLKLHIQTKHTLEMPFKCNECDYSATKASNLKLHVQAKHTLEKPFKCNECDYSSNR